MKATDLFPEKEERLQVKSFLELFNGVLTQVTNTDGKVVYENNPYVKRKLTRWPFKRITSI